MSYKARLEFPRQEKSIFRPFKLKFLLDVEICFLLLPRVLICIKSFRVSFFRLLRDAWSNSRKQSSYFLPPITGERVQEGTPCVWLCSSARVIDCLMGLL